MAQFDTVRTQPHTPLHMSHVKREMGDSACRVEVISFLFFMPFLFNDHFIKQGSFKVVNSWKNLEICAAIFQTWKKVWKIETKSCKIVKSPEFFESYNKCFISDIFFRFRQIWLNLAPYVCSASSKMRCSSFFFRSLFITYLITLTLEEEIILFSKSQFGSKNLFEPWSKYQTFTKVLWKTHYFSEPRFNEPLRNEVLSKANDFLYPSSRKVYEKETSL